MRATVLQGDALAVLKTLPSNGVDMVMTSPPYWGLRDYGHAGQLGLEPDFRDYINNLCDIFDEVKRVLKPEVTCWVNLGDKYSSTTKGSGGRGKSTLGPNGDLQNIQFQKFQSRKLTPVVPSKSLCQIPARFAIEMTDRGWILRNEIIWHKPNAMPQSVKDRFSVDFEKLLFFTKSKTYYFEQQFDPYAGPRHAPGNAKPVVYGVGDQTRQQSSHRNPDKVWGDDRGKNKRAVWSIPTKPYPEAHFAVFPEWLCETPIKAGSPITGTVLDPFTGSGTTGAVALRLARNFIGIELNPEYIKLAEKRLAQWTQQVRLAI